MNFAESALIGYLRELATHRTRNKRLANFEVRVARVRLVSLMSARMIELNGAWNPYEDLRLLWAFEYCRFSDEGGDFRIPNEDAILFLITGDDHPAVHTRGRGSESLASATA